MNYLAPYGPGWVSDRDGEWHLLTTFAIWGKRVPTACGSIRNRPGTLNMGFTSDPAPKCSQCGIAQMVRRIMTIADQLVVG